MIKWVPGRQLTCDYHKVLIYKFKFLNLGFDCYLLRYMPNTILPPHKDPVRNGIHVRFNFLLFGSCTFLSEDYILKTSVLNIFRSDLCYHSLVVFDSFTYKLSFGFVWFK